MSDFRISKHVSRIAAVQAMYQMDISGFELNGIVDNFVNYYLSNEDEYKKINLKFFKKLIYNFSSDIDFMDIINRNIDPGKKTISPSVISNSIIKVAIIEMIFENTDIPVIINEYIEIAKDFVDKNGVKFINAILDKISKQVERECLKKQ